jgi:hypothetical protein
VATLPPRPHTDAAWAHADTYVAIPPYNAIIAVATNLNVHLRYSKFLGFGRGSADKHRRRRKQNRGGRRGENDLDHRGGPSEVNTQRVTGSNQQSSIVDLN